MVMIQLTDKQREAISEAIRHAEMNTSAEIVCVVARMSSDYAALPYMWAALLALAVPWPLVAFTGLAVQTILAIQLATFALGFAFLSLDRIRLALAPRAMRRAHAHRAALEQFVTRGLSQTRGRSGVLIFVSLAERYVRVIADEAVNAHIARAEWQEVVDVLISEVRNGRLAEGMVAAIQRCGALLAERLPDDGSQQNELPDRIYLI
jgi:putative membrane protein